MQNCVSEVGSVQFSSVTDICYVEVTTKSWGDYLHGLCLVGDHLRRAGPEKGRGAPAMASNGQQMPAKLGSKEMEAAGPS